MDPLTTLAAGAKVKSAIASLHLPAGVKSWAALLDYLEERDHADYRDRTCSELLLIYKENEP